MTSKRRDPEPTLVQNPSVLLASGGCEPTVLAAQNSALTGTARPANHLNLHERRVAVGVPPKLEKKYPFTDEVLLTLPVDTLAGANLPGQILAVTDLDGRDLQGANRAEAKLAGCSPRGAVLTGTGLTCFPPRDFQGTTE